jgi:hypothetical protein
VNVGVEENDVAFDRRREGCIGEPREEDILLVHFTVLCIHVLAAKDELPGFDKLGRGAWGGAGAGRDTNNKPGTMQRIKRGI